MFCRENNVKDLVRLLFGDMREKLLFIWVSTHSYICLVLFFDGFSTTLYLFSDCGFNTICTRFHIIYWFLLLNKNSYIWLFPAWDLVSQSTYDFCIYYFCRIVRNVQKVNYLHHINPTKKIVFKDLKKVWDDHQFKNFNAKNTLLVDDSPYKALLNPVSQLFIFLVLVSQLFLLIC